MRALSTKVPAASETLVDTCGTGGDGADTFNISTAVAFTAAACGVNVAKHGNRSASGKVGSADVLEGLGLHLKAPLSKVVEALPGTGVTFLFAPAWHPALVNLAPLRRTRGVRTVVNLLGPLVNPLQPQESWVIDGLRHHIDARCSAELGRPVRSEVILTVMPPIHRQDPRPQTAP